MKRNYDGEMQEICRKLTAEGRLPRLLLHSCCAPCSTSVLEQLAGHFLVTVFYYNPNIAPAEEYYFRKEEQKTFIKTFPFAHPVDFLEAEYEPKDFYEAVKGLEQEPERGERCTVCYRLRLHRTAQAAAAGGFDYFATTLTLSPLKDPERLNRIGEEEGAAARERGSSLLWLPSDFKKRNGYLRSIELTKEYGMYRQNYCGCAFSLRDRQAEDKAGCSCLEDKREHKAPGTSRQEDRL